MLLICVIGEGSPGVRWVLGGIPGHREPLAHTPPSTGSAGAGGSKVLALFWNNSKEAGRAGAHQQMTSMTGSVALRVGCVLLRLVVLKGN